MRKEKSVFAVDYANRIIWLDGHITPKTGNDFFKALIKLKKSGSGEIIFYIRGPGGDPYSAFYMMRSMTDSGLHIGCVAHDYVGSGCFTLTQGGIWTAALPGTKFAFHPSVSLFQASKRQTEMTQAELLEEFEKLKFIDYLQLWWFYAKGKQLCEVYSLFKKEELITVPMAIKLGLVDKYFRRKDFLEDKKRIKMILKNKKNKHK